MSNAICGNDRGQRPRISLRSSGLRAVAINCKAATSSLVDPPPDTSLAALTMCHPPHKRGRDKEERASLASTPQKGGGIRKIELQRTGSFLSLPREAVGSRRAKLALGWLAEGQSGGGWFNAFRTLSMTPARLSSISEFQKRRTLKPCERRNASRT